MNDSARTRLLILGGTTEAAALARALADRPGIECISSLAGRTREPAALPGGTRVGGFGGAAGLVEYLRAERIAGLIDATHPFAAQISTHAVAAARVAEVPLLRLERAPWRRLPLPPRPPLLPRPRRVRNATVSAISSPPSRRLLRARSR